MRRTSTALLAVLLLSSCERSLPLMFNHNIRSYRITDANKDTFYDDIKHLRGLTVEEAFLLHSHLIADGLSNAFGRRPQLVGKTIGDLIEEARVEEEKSSKNSAAAAPKSN